MSEITRNQAIQIVEDIRTAISAGSVTNTMEAQVLEYCVSVLGRRIVEASLSGHIENLPDVAAFLAGISPSATLKALLEGITDAVEVINANIGNGYVYAGIATPSGTPVSGKVFYLAKQAGQYANFGGLTVTEGFNILKRNGSTWTQEQLLSMADIRKNPLIGYYECDTAGDTSAKTVTAAGYVLPATGGSVKIKMANSNTVANATLNINSTGAKPLYYNGQRAGVGNTWDTNEIIEVFYDGTKYQAYNVAGSNGDGVFDISAYNLTNGQPTPYEDLAAALGTNGANVPESYRRGGMTVKYVQSSDNKYVQYRLMSNSFNTTVANWQGVDVDVINGSKNLIENDGVARSLAFRNPIIQKTREIDLVNIESTDKSIIFLDDENNEFAHISENESDFICLKSNGKEVALKEDIGDISSSYTYNDDEVIEIADSKGNVITSIKGAVDTDADEESIEIQKENNQKIFTLKEKGIEVKNVFDLNGSPIDKSVYSSISVFQDIAVCGDSYAEGGVALTNPNESFTNENMSWGKILGRMFGINVSVYAKGGASVSSYITTSKCLPLLLSETQKQLYAISLGHNDMYQGTTVGNRTTRNTFMGDYAYIIEQIQSHAPHAMIVLLRQSRPYCEMNNGAELNEAISELGEYYGLPVFDPNDDIYLSSDEWVDTMSRSHPVYTGYAGLAQAFARQFSYHTVTDWDYFMRLGTNRI